MTDVFLSLNWSNIALLTFAATTALIFFVRTERRRRWVALLVLPLPVCAGMGLVGWLSQQWPEVWLSLLFTIILYQLYERLIAPRFPPRPKADIKVWGQED